MELWKSSSSPLNNLPERFWFSSLEKYHRDWASDRFHQEGPGKDNSSIFCLSWINGDNYISFISFSENREEKWKYDHLISNMCLLHILLYMNHTNYY